MRWTITAAIRARVPVTCSTEGSGFYDLLSFPGSMDRGTGLRMGATTLVGGSHTAKVSADGPAELTVKIK